MNTEELLEKAKKEAAEKLKKGAAEGKNATQIVMETIEQNHEITAEEISALRAKYQRMEETVDDMKRRDATAAAFGNKSNSGTLVGEIERAVKENVTGLKGLYTGEVKYLRMQTKSVADMLVGTHLTGGTASVSDPVLGPVGMAYTLNNVRDMLRRVTITSGNLPILKDNGGEGTITPVSEGAEKPQVDFDLAEANAKAETIAGVATVSKQFFDDVSNSQIWIRDRLLELYNATENDQLLNGSGVSPNLKGLNTSGNFTAATGGATIPIEQLVQALLQMRIQKRRASGIIINPDALETLILNKASGSMEYDLPSMVTVSPAGQIMIMGVPVVDVAEQPTGTFTVHDNSGSLYAVRQGITIEFFAETLAKYNKILIRIESRLSFPNFGTSFTVKGTFV